MTTEVSLGIAKARRHEPEVPHEPDSSQLARLSSLVAHHHLQRATLCRCAVVQVHNILFSTPVSSVRGLEGATHLIVGLDPGVGELGGLGSKDLDEVNDALQCTYPSERVDPVLCDRNIHERLFGARRSIQLNSARNVDDSPSPSPRSRSLHPSDLSARSSCGMRQRAWKKWARIWTSSARGRKRVQGGWQSLCRTWRVEKMRERERGGWPSEKDVMSPRSSEEWRRSRRGVPVRPRGLPIRGQMT